LIDDNGIEQNISSEDANQTIEWAEDYNRAAEDYF